MKLKFTGFISFAFLLLSCSSGSDTLDSNKIRMVIDSYRSPCVGLIQRLCLRTRTGQDSNFGNFYSAISGFDYTWGSRYEVVIETTKIENPPADSSSIRYRLIEIISTTEDVPGKVYQFSNVDLFGNTLVKENEQYKFLGMPFICASNLDCDSLVSTTSLQGLVDLSFEYLGNGQIRLAKWQQR